MGSDGLKMKAVSYTMLRHYLSQKYTDDGHEHCGREIECSQVLHRQWSRGSCQALSLGKTNKASNLVSNKNMAVSLGRVVCVISSFTL